MSSRNFPAFGQVGRRIRKERRRAGLTLTELAKRVGVSPSYISLVENGKSVPSLKILDQICTSLSIHLSMLFAAHEENAPESHAVFREATHINLNVSERRQIRFLMPRDDLPLKAVRLLIQPGDDHGSFSTHEGVEFGYVVRGGVDFTIREANGKESRTACAAGDSFLYDAMRPHRFLNTGGVEAELMLVAVSTMSM